MKKKNYNPFKMWGSWVGAILVLIYNFFIISKFRGGLYVYSSIGDIMGYVDWSLVLAQGFLIGFLIGWGIHSLVRALRK